jgi:thiol reductant ABC exporter CydD subunit
VRAVEPSVSGIRAVGAATGSAPERRLTGHDRRARRWLVVAIAAGYGATLALIAQLITMALAVAGVFLQERTLEDVLPLLVAGLLLLLLRTALGVAGELAARRAAVALVGTLRADLTGQLLRLGPTWTGGERSGEIHGVLVGGLEAIEDYVTTYLPARWLAMLVPLSVLLIVALLDPFSVLVLLFTGPLLLLLLMVIGGRTRAISERRFMEMRTLSAFFLDILRGLPTLKMFGRSREQVENLRRISSRYGDATMDVLRTAFQTSLVLEWGATIAIALVAVEIGLRLLAGTIDFERALAVLLITPEFFLPLRALAIRFHIGTAGKAVTGRVFGILDLPVPTSPAAVSGDASAVTTASFHATEAAPGPGPTHAPTGGPTARPALEQPPHIRFEAVRFTYPGRSARALNGLSLELASATSLALVGASGAGKSSLASLLLRFITPDEGDIVVDGQPLAHIDLAAWRASLAWVPQRPHLFDGTIGANIRLARPDATDAAVIAAAEAANAADFIARLPRGYETPVGEAGSRLSGGQRQRLAIARAFLRDAPLLVLDEATSHQDEASEEAIRDALSRLLAGRTALIIAHRLRLAERADQVAVLQAGRVVQRGIPGDLLAAGGPYRRLVEDHGEASER